MDLSIWQEPFSSDECMSIARSVGAIFAGRLGPHHPLYRRFACGDWDGVARYTPDLSAPPAQYFAEVQLIALFKKAPFLPVATDPDGTALAKFIDSERECVRTNVIFDKYEAGHFMFGERVERILFRTQRKISYVLGDLPSVSNLSFRFTSGASTELKKKDTSIRNQLMADLSCSEDMWDSGLAAAVLRAELTWTGARSEPAPEDPRVYDLFLSRVGGKISYEKHLPDKRDGGRDYGGNVGYDAPYCTLVERPLWCRVAASALEFVPKTAFESRVIIKEPPLNKYAQTAYGDVIRKRLKDVVGIDISTATPLHRELARQASLTGDLATLDLTSASDLNAYKMIQSLYPIDWFAALADCRTSRVAFKGYVFELEKFSGMGNGFTFPLQTLTYWALVCACVEEVGGDVSQVRVFGDDIICPVSAVPVVRTLFHAIGLKINPEKSFWSGSFRESCGGDWLFGVDVRPIYVKDTLSLEKLFILHNGFFRKGELECAEVILSYIPKDFHIFGPDGYGDGHLLRSLVEMTPMHRYKRVKEKGQRVSVATGWALMGFKTIAMEPRYDWERSHYDHAAVLYTATGGPEHSEMRSEPRQRSTEVYKRELERYLADGMSLSRSIRTAQNAVMRALLPDEVLVSRQKRVAPDRCRLTYVDPVVASDDYVIGMPLPGTEVAQVRTICIFG